MDTIPPLQHYLYVGPSLVLQFVGFGARFLPPFPKSLATVKYYSNTRMAVNSRQWPLMGDTLVQKKAPLGATQLSRRGVQNIGGFLDLGR